ncbi:HEAT repeat domain-containing protein [Tahibacter amnicola]|uniref:HEAT repeat domain-containing protein n=1 Tax=Tahibacter amnicola TaxID=2976241 RepID=A0ABY6BFS7_9GAMM|nr:HEAT repeat domain-containing protein [Tahibacter amnicola]UXI68883.1 HEAT repeat domain-containing protein [Tahibacter amnicola]
MKTALLAAIAFVGSPAALADGFSSAMGKVDGWAGWRVPLAEGVAAPCCQSHSRKGDLHRRCHLDERDWSVTTHKPVASGASGDLLVFARIEGGKVRRLRVTSEDCPIDSTVPVSDLGAPAPAESVAWLTAQLGTSQSDEAMAAIAWHAGAPADAALKAAAAPGRPMKVRENALFWIGQTRGAAGVETIARFATQDPDAALREKAIFALSQAEGTDTFDRIRAIARDDAAPSVRGQAMFWLAQQFPERAEAEILSLITREKDESVREEGVFALSQLGDERAAKALIAVARGNYPRDVRRQAIFWLGQTGSDEAIAFLDTVLSAPER